MNEKNDVELLVMNGESHRIESFLNNSIFDSRQVRLMFEPDGKHESGQAYSFVLLHLNSVSALP